MNNLKNEKKLSACLYFLEKQSSSTSSEDKIVHKKIFIKKINGYKIVSSFYKPIIRLI